MSGEIPASAMRAHLEPRDPEQVCAVCEDPVGGDRYDGADFYRAGDDLVHYECEQRYVARDESEPVLTRLQALANGGGDEILDMRLRDGSTVRGSLCDWPTPDGRGFWSVDDVDGEAARFDPAQVARLEVVDA